MQDKNKKQNIGYWNCASGILNKLEYTKDMIKENELAIFFVSESDIGEHFDLILLLITGYDSIYDALKE